MKTKLRSWMLTGILMLPLFTVTSWANGIEVDGIHYVLDGSAETASVTYTGSRYDYGNTYSGTINIPPSFSYNGTTYTVISIGYHAFYGCSGLTSVTIPSSITSIGSEAFYCCSGLTSIIVEAGNTVYDSRDNCNAIIKTTSNTLIVGCKGTVIPNSVTSIGNYAFESCSGLTSVNIPSSVTSIGSRAFSGCSGMMSVTIPSSVTSIGEEAFYGCSGLTSIIVEAGNTVYDSRDNCNAIIKTTSNTLIAGCKGTVIPNSVTSIGNYAFESCSGLTTVNIPNSVTFIGSYAFESCSGLTTVNIPNSVKTIGNSAFWGCTSLIRVNITDLAAWCGISFGDSESNPLKYANHLYLNDSEITSLIIPDEVSEIKQYAFYGCSGLTSVNIPNSVTSIGNKAFDYTALYNSQPNGIVYADKWCIGYKRTNPTGAITFKDGTTGIAGSAFESCTNLTSITIPNSVTNINAKAFKGCTGLTSVTIGNSVKSIGDEAFDGCSGLTRVNITDLAAWCGISFSSFLSNPLYYAHRLYLNGTEVTSLVIPDGVTSIGNWAFEDCTSLTSATIPNSVTNINARAFSGCSGLTSVTIPNSVTSIGGSAFYGCTGLTRVKITDLEAWCNISFNYYDANPLYYAHRLNLNGTEVTSLVIPDGVTKIKQYAFDHFTALKSVTIPNSVTSIEDCAFQGCTHLTDFSIPISVTSIGNSAFRACTRLTDVTIPTSVTSIGRAAFYSCTGLTSVSIPNSVINIDNNAFYSCTSLTSINLYWKKPTDCKYGYYMLYNVPATATLYIPTGTTSLYAATSPWNGFTNFVEVGRENITLKSAMGTYCSENDLDFTGMLLEAYTATSFSDGVLTLTKLNKVPAGTGIVLRGEKGTYNVPIAATHTYLVNLLKGTNEPITLKQIDGNMTNFILANGSAGIGFYKVSSKGGTLAAHKAYLQLPTDIASSTRPLVMRFEDEDGQTTDIQYIYTTPEDGSKADGAVYDLQGRRVTQPQKGGIYIVNGKKVRL